MTHNVKPPRHLTAAELDPAIDLGRIRPSRSQPRRSFRGLDELAASIEASGVRNPVLVRPVEPDPASEHPVADLELVHGERRWRGSTLAGRTTIPGIVQEMTDEAVLDEQLVEQGGRADLDPLDQAEMLADRVRRGATVKGLAARLGKSPAWVADRISLTELIESARDVLLAELISVSVAGLLAPLPAEQQAAALATILDGRPVIGEAGREQLTFREAKSVVGEVAARAASAAAFDARAAEATRAGTVVLDGPAPLLDGSYVLASADLPMDLADASGEHTWGDLLGDDPPAAVLGRTASGAPVELYERAEVVRRATAAGLLTAAGEPDRKTKVAAMSSAELKAQREKDQQKFATQRRVVQAQCGALATAAIPEPSSGAKEAALWRWIATTLAEQTDTVALEHVIARRGLRLGTAANAEAAAIAVHAEQCKTTGALRALVIEILAATVAPAPHVGAGRGFGELAELLRVDLKVVAAEVAAAMRAAASPVEAATKPGGKGKKGKS